MADGREQLLQVQPGLAEELFAPQAPRDQAKTALAAYRGQQEGGPFEGDHRLLELPIGRHVFAGHDHRVGKPAATRCGGQERFEGLAGVGLRLQGLEVRDQPLRARQVDRLDRSAAGAIGVDAGIAFDRGGQRQPDGRRKHAGHAPQADSGVQQYRAPLGRVLGGALRRR